MSCFCYDIGPIDRVLLQLGPIKVHWYGVCAAIGFYLAFLYANYQVKQKKLPSNLPNDLFVCGVLGGIIGARILYVITFFELFKNNFWGMFKVWEGGLVFNGGFVGAAITIFAYCMIKKLPKLEIADILAVCIPLGHAFGRIGCWLNGCCYGKESHGFLSMRHYLPDGTVSPPYFPIQLLGTLGNLSLALLLFFLSKKIKQPGWLLPIYVLCYGTTRFFGEFLRGDFSGSTTHLGGYALTPAQFFSLTRTIPFGLCLLIGIFIYYHNKNRSSAPSQEK